MTRTARAIPRRLILLGTTGLAIAIAACAGEPGGSPDVVVDTVVGVERLTWPSDLGERLGWAVDTVAVIGEAMGEAEYQFGAPSADDMTGDAAGNVLVVDRQGTRVLEYGPDGRHRATYGRPGEGPGELKFPMGVAVGPGDTVWVNDLMNRRVTGFPREGGDPRTVPYTRGDVFPGPRVARHQDGFLQVMGAMGPPGEPIPEPLLLLDDSLNALDTLWIPPPDKIDVVELEIGDRSMVVGMSQEFRPAFHWRALSDGSVVVADSADYVFRLIDGDGSVRRIVRRDPPARATTDDDREAARQRIRREAEEGAGIAVGRGSRDADAQRRIAEERIEKMTFYDRIPRIVALRVDRSDRIWVGVSEEAPGEVERIDVYDREGQLLGELEGVPMPKAFTGDDRLLTTRTDELDVPQIVVLRVETAGR